MQPQITTSDNLTHIQYQDPNLKADDPNLLRNQVSSTEGRIVIVSAFGCSLVLQYSFGPLSIQINLVLETPVGSVTLISATLDPQNPTVTAGGSIDSFKAEATVSYDFKTHMLSATGEVCAPIVGCKKGSIQIHV